MLHKERVVREFARILRIPPGTTEWSRRGLVENRGRMSGQPERGGMRGAERAGLMMTDERKF